MVARLKLKFNRWYKVIKPYLTWKFIISFSIAWFITNGHAYVLLGFGIWLNIDWMKWYGGTYLSILWLPCTPEKLITIPLSVFIHWLLFREKIDSKKLIEDLSKKE